MLHITTFFFELDQQERLLTCLKHLGLADFLITNIGIFSQRSLDVAIPAIHTLLRFPLKQRLPRKWKDFDGSALQNRPNWFALKTSFSWYLANIGGKFVSSQEEVISFVTFSDSPDTSLKVISCLQRRVWKSIFESVKIMMHRLNVKESGKMEHVHDQKIKKTNHDSFET